MVISCHEFSSSGPCVPLNGQSNTICRNISNNRKITCLQKKDSDYFASVNWLRGMQNYGAVCLAERDK